MGQQLQRVFPGQSTLPYINFTLNSFPAHYHIPMHIKQSLELDEHARCTHRQEGRERERGEEREIERGRYVLVRVMHVEPALPPSWCGVSKNPTQFGFGNASGRPSLLLLSPSPSQPSLLALLCVRWPKICGEAHEVCPGDLRRQSGCHSR